MNWLLNGMWQDSTWCNMIHMTPKYGTDRTSYKPIHHFSGYIYICLYWNSHRNKHLNCNCLEMYFNITLVYVYLDCEACKSSHPFNWTLWGIGNDFDHHQWCSKCLTQTANDIFHLWHINILIVISCMHTNDKTKLPRMAICLSISENYRVLLVCIGYFAVTVTSK